MKTLRQLLGNFEVLLILQNLLMDSNLVMYKTAKPSNTTICLLITHKILCFCSLLGNV